GTVLVVGGMNSHGVSASWGREPSSGSPASADIRLAEVLAKSEDLEQAIDQVSRQADAAPSDVVLSDARADRVASIHLSSSGVEISSDGPLVRVGRQLTAAGHWNRLSEHGLAPE